MDCKKPDSWYKKMFLSKTKLNFKYDNKEVFIFMELSCKFYCQKHFSAFKNMLIPSNILNTQACTMLCTHTNIPQISKISHCIICIDIKTRFSFR